MDIADLKNELQSLPPDERRQLSAFLISPRHKELSGYRERLAEKIDDSNGDNWVSFEEFNTRISS